MTICLLCGAHIDWWQLLPEIIATFVGFILALFGQFLWEKGKEIKEAKHLLERIAKELKGIKQVLIDIDPVTYEMQPLKTLIWDEAINAGKISLLEETKRERLLKIYKQIQEINSWFAIQTKYVFDNNGRPNENLQIELIKQKCLLLGKAYVLTKAETDCINEKGYIDGKSAMEAITDDLEKRFGNWISIDDILQDIEA